MALIRKCGNGSSWTHLASALAMVWTAGPLWAVGMGVLTVTLAAVPVAAAWATKTIMDGLAHTNGLASVTGLAVGLAIMSLALAVIPLIRTYAAGELDRRISLLAQDRLFSVVGRLPGLSKFEDPAFLDRLRLAGQSGGLTPAQVGEAGLGLLAGVVTITGFTASLVLLSPWMAIAVLAGAVPALIAEILLAKRRAMMMWEIGPVERREFFYIQLMSSVEAAKEVRLFGLNDFLHKRMLGERTEANSAKRRMDLRELHTQIMLGALSAIISGSGLIWAIMRADEGALTVGDISIFIAATGGVQAGLVGLIAQIGVAHRNLLLFSHYQHVVKTEPDIPLRTDSELPRLEDAITLKDVWFRYSPDQPWILRGLDLKIPKGASVALVGLNGSGKSTLVKLLCRFYDPERGLILWDGVDIREVDTQDLRNKITAVFQDFMQYELTVAENIGLGDLSKFSDRNAVRQAAKRAGVHDTIERFTKGYDTLMTRLFVHDDDATEGVFLSGGQGQRVAIARALLRDERDLLILDEPSSGLDAEAEHEIHLSLKEHRRGRTSLLISHRLGAVREADVIAVLDQGRVSELGSHSELMAMRGLYARLFTVQASGYQE